MRARSATKGPFPPSGGAMRASSAGEAAPPTAWDSELHRSVNDVRAGPKILDNRRIGGGGTAINDGPKWNKGVVY